MSTNTFGTRRSLPDGHGGHVDLYSLRALEASGYPGVGRLPYSLKDPPGEHAAPGGRPAP